MARATSPTGSDKSSTTFPTKKANSTQDPETEDSANENEKEGEEEEEEYEIEEIIDAKRGYFPDGRIGYLVKWKGYGSADNSWVDERDAENAGELVQDFWKKHPRKAPRSSDAKSPKKARQSTTGDTVSEATKKRGRKSVSKAQSDEDMEKDNADEDSLRVNKRAKKNAGGASKSVSAGARTQSPEAAQQVIIKGMKQYMHVASWETLVKSVDTVERTDNQELVVYFSLHNGEQVKENSTLCKERFPQKLLNFYEGNLRWKSADELD